MRWHLRSSSYLLRFGRISFDLWSVTNSSILSLVWKASLALELGRSVTQSAWRSFRTWGLQWIRVRLQQMRTFHGFSRILHPAMYGTARTGKSDGLRKSCGRSHLIQEGTRSLQKDSEPKRSRARKTERTKRPGRLLFERRLRTAGMLGELSHNIVKGESAFSRNQERVKLLGVSAPMGSAKCPCPARWAWRRFIQHFSFPKISM